jgi:hypothetical protein
MFLSIHGGGGMMMSMLLVLVLYSFPDWQLAAHSLAAGSLFLDSLLSSRLFLVDLTLALGMTDAWQHAISYPVGIEPASDSSFLYFTSARPC